MLRRAQSLISLATIDPVAEPYRDEWDDDPIAITITGSSGDGGDDDDGVSSSLCIRCQNFDIQSFGRVAGRRKGYLLRDVEEAAAAGHGCEFCALLLDAVKDVPMPEYFYINIFSSATVIHPDLYVHMTVSENYKDGNEKPAHTVSSSGLRANRIHVEIGGRFTGVRNPSGHEICLAADPNSPAALNGDIIGRYIGGDPNTDLHYHTIQNWIRECTSHSKCNETVSGSIHIDPYDSPLPSRVIEIAQENGQQRVYLRYTDGLRGAYMTLTHRWNESTGKCVTTTSNIERRLLGEDFGGLPQLFQGAFSIAEKLGIRFVWIDSICIIQKGDDGADWLHEAPRMAQYYQYSVFTLAGTVPDGSGGLFQSYAKEAVPWSKLVRLPYRDNTNAEAGYFYCYKRRSPVVDEYMDKVRSSILFQRGWILQEWLLSKRLLWYTSHGLFFECQQELPRAYDQSQIAFSRAGSDLQAYLRLKASFHHTNDSILDFWYSALEIYSGQRLTKPREDRILAIAGLAKEVAPILSNPKRLPGSNDKSQDEVYTAGLWLRDIHHGLLWEEGHTATGSASRIKEAPSWSWTSLLTVVRWAVRSKGTKKAFTVTGVCFAEGERQHDAAHSIVDGCRLSPVNRVPQKPNFDPTNLFSCLHIRGKLHTVHVRGYLETEENLTSAARSTGYSPIPKSCNWRAICSAFRPDTIAGWGSLEQLKPHPTACADYGIAMHALHVSTRYLRYGLLIKKSIPVFDVLFLEEISEGSGCFRRLGVGRIGDVDLMAEVREAEERSIYLV